MAEVPFLSNRGSVTHQGRVEVGAPGLVGFKVVVVDNSFHELSPWHHVPLYPPECDSILFHFVCTTPAGTTLHFRPDISQPFSPLSLLSNCGRASRFESPLPCNYGFLPQTCCMSSSKEGTSEASPSIRNPINILEIGSGSKRKTGQIYAVKVLGAFCFSGSAEGANKQWTLIGVASDHSMAEEVTDVADLEDKLPGVLKTVQEWAQAACQTEGEGVWTCELVDSQAASFQVVDAHGVWRDVCSGEGDPLMDDRARDRRLRARRRGVWSEDISTRRLSKVQKDVMFRPSAALLRRDVFGNVGGDVGGEREVFEDVGGESGNNAGKGRTSAGEQNTRLGTKADLRSPKESGKVGGVFERIQRARRMSMGSIKDWGGKEEAFDLFLKRGWKEAESSPTRVDTAAAHPVSPVQTLTGGRRRGIFRSVFTKWRGVRCFEPTMVDS